VNIVNLITRTMFDLEEKTVKQRNKIDTLEQENEELKETILINRRFNKLSLKERINVAIDIKEISNRLENIDQRVKQLEVKPKKKKTFKFLGE